jgi:hypothetical protein
MGFDHLIVYDEFIARCELSCRLPGFSLETEELNVLIVVLVLPDRMTELVQEVQFTFQRPTVVVIHRLVSGRPARNISVLEYELRVVFAEFTY